MHEAWQRGDAQEALAIHLRLTPLHRALFLETSPAPVKYAVARLGKCAPEVRLPLVAPKAADQGEGRRRDGRGRPDQLSRPWPSDAWPRTAPDARWSRATAGRATTISSTSASRPGSCCRAPRSSRCARAAPTSTRPTPSRAGRRAVPGQRHDPRVPRRQPLQSRARAPAQAAAAPARDGQADRRDAPRRRDRDPAVALLQPARHRQGRARRSPAARRPTTSAPRIKERDWQREKERLMREKG